MKSRFRRMLVLSVSLVVPSAALYGLQLVLFPDPRTVWLGLLSQLAFLPLYYLFTTIVIDAALARKEREDRLRRVNVLVGVFFHEVGDALLARSTGHLSSADRAVCSGRIEAAWDEADFAKARRDVEAAHPRFDLDEAAFLGLAGLLGAHRDGLLRLMQNPSLLEHESFTELLLAVFHLVDEFDRRPAPKEFSAADVAHLEGDLRRAYVLLRTQWLSYVQHLKREYPYLYSLVVRTGPAGAAPEVPAAV
jgi:hypothetical protein